MHQADLQHSDKQLQDKLERIFQLRRTKSAVNWDRSMFFDLLEKFGNPHTQLPPVIHVAGTNGKGSVIAMLRSIFEAAGKTVHCYTSPHLMHVNERIYLAGKPIDNQHLERLLDEALGYIDNAPLSFFEITTALAFKAFSQTPADVLLLEVGMGGRLDCTNVIAAPIATVINRISMDHTEFLGDTIAQIAGEKAGIMKKDVPCIVGYQGVGADEILDVLHKNAQQERAIMRCYGTDWTIDKDESDMVFSEGGAGKRYPLPALVGEHQVLNAGVVLATLTAVRDQFPIADDAIIEGLKSVHWPGRLQRLNDVWPYDTQGCEIWLDSGHNDSAAEVLARQIGLWREEDDRPVHLIMGMLKTKNAAAYLKPLLPLVTDLHIVPISSDPNAQSGQSIADLIPEGDFSHDHIHDETDVLTVVRTIIEQSHQSRVVITGSVYLSGEVLGFVQGLE